MVISCCFEWTLCAVLIRWNLRVARTLQHRRRSYSILQKINQKFVVGQIIGKQWLAIFRFDLCVGGGKGFASIMSMWNKSGGVCLWRFFIKEDEISIYFHVNYIWIIRIVGYGILPICSFWFFQNSVILGVFLYIIYFGVIQIWRQRTGLI